jgi:hypothetical protein
MFPQSPAVVAAFSLATRFCPPALLNHFDDELYYVSALLHDIGLTETFDSNRLASRTRATSRSPAQRRHSSRSSWLNACAARACDRTVPVERD